ncbi:MAG: peptidoglycan-binding protein [Bacillota bacterium]
MLRAVLLCLAGLLTLVFLVPVQPAWSCQSPEPLRPQDPPVWRLDVADLKVQLGLYGYWAGAIDDCYDAKAQEAVRAFQKDHGLEPNGVVDDTTWQLLGQDLEVETATGPGPPVDGAKLILVDTDRLFLTLYVDGQPFKIWPIAVGRTTMISPVGEWKIINKGNKGGPFGTRWMGLNVPWGTYGIHGTNAPGSIGTRASQGCIRMHNRHVEELYEWVEVGTRVKITGVEPRLTFNSTIRRGSTGEVVVKVQNRLSQFGFDPGYADGRYGQATEKMVRELQAVYGLALDGSVGIDIYFLLGLR